MSRKKNKTSKPQGDAAASSQASGSSLPPQRPGGSFEELQAAVNLIGQPENEPSPEAGETEAEDEHVGVIGMIGQNVGDEPSDARRPYDVRQQKAQAGFRHAQLRADRARRKIVDMRMRDWLKHNAEYRMLQEKEEQLRHGQHLERLRLAKKLPAVLNKLEAVTKVVLEVVNSTKSLEIITNDLHGVHHQLGDLEGQAWGKAQSEVERS